MKHTKPGFSFKACRLPPPILGELKGLYRGQNSSFLKHGHVAYQIKKLAHASNMVENVNP